MTSRAEAADRTAVGPTTPPWLWVWLIGDLVVLIPAEISDERNLFATYTGHAGTSARLTAGTPYKLLFLFAVLAGLTYAVLAAGAVAALLPHLRGRWVERRFRLSATDQVVVADMQRYVNRYTPTVQLRLTISNGQMARIYPVGWRRARIAVFLPLVALWERDRPAAQAILLHEMAHYCHGDQLAVGLGSPFVWLIRIWVPAFVLLVVSPIGVYFALGGGLLAQAVSGQGALQLMQPASLLILPVTALWLAELNADALTVYITGTAPLLEALRITAQTPASVTARALALLSHPPLRLRVRSARPRALTTVVVLAAWPAALIAQLAVLILGALMAELLIGQPLRQTGIDLAAGIRLFLVSNEVLIIAITVLLLLWPVLSRPWSTMRTFARRGERQPWGPYLAAAAVPAALIGLSFTPLPTGFAPPVPTAAQGACGQLGAWRANGGLTLKAQADAELAITESAQDAGDPAAETADANALLAVATAALRDPPPGTVRSSYTSVMGDFRTVALALLAGKTTTAESALGNAVTADTGTTRQLLSQLGEC